MLAIGLGVLRLSPDAFWAMTLPELAAALRGLLGPGGDRSAMARKDLDTLMQKFPDQGPVHG